MFAGCLLDRVNGVLLADRAFTIVAPHINIPLCQCRQLFQRKNIKKILFGFVRNPEVFYQQFSRFVRRPYRGLCLSIYVGLNWTFQSKGQSVFLFN